MTTAHIKFLQLEYTKTKDLNKILWWLIYCCKSRLVCLETNGPNMLDTLITYEHISLLTTMAITHDSQLYLQIAACTLLQLHTCIGVGFANLWLNLASIDCSSTSARLAGLMLIDSWVLGKEFKLIYVIWYLVCTTVAFAIYFPRFKMTVWSVTANLEKGYSIN
jgi:hypothetical protein